MKAKTRPAPAMPDLPIPQILAEARLGDLKALAEEPFDYSSLPGQGVAIGRIETPAANRES
jgi:hypothetical protein